MNIELLQFILSLIAILLLAFLAKIYWPKSQILDKQRVLRAFDRSDYTVSLQNIWLNSSSTAALTQLHNSKDIGYAFSFGDRVTCRVLSTNDFKFSKIDDQTLKFEFADYTLNNTTINFPDISSCSEAVDMLTKSNIRQVMANG